MESVLITYFSVGVILSSLLFLLTSLAMLTKKGMRLVKRIPLIGETIYSIEISFNKNVINEENAAQLTTDILVSLLTFMLVCVFSWMIITILYVPLMVVFIIFYIIKQRIKTKTNM